MATELGKLTIEVEAKFAKLESDLGKLQATVNSEMDKIKRSLTTTGDAFTALGSKMLGLAAILGVGFGISNIINSFSRLRDEIDKMAKSATQIGITTEALSSMNYVAERSGVSTEVLATAFTEMGRRISQAAAGIGPAKKTLEELGLNAEKLTRITPDKQFLAIAQAMEKIQNQTDRARIAMDLWSRGGAPLLRMLDDGASGVERLIRRFEDLGGVITEDMAKRMEDAKAATLDLNKAWEGLLTAFMVSFGPGITGVIEGITEAIITLRKVTEEYGNTFLQVVKYAQLAINLATKPGLAIPELLKMGKEKLFPTPSGEYLAAETFYGPRDRTRTAGYERPDLGRGGRARDTSRQIQSIIDTLNKELAKLAEGSLAVIVEWYDQIVRKIQEYATSAQQAEETINLARQVALAKYENTIDSFNKWYSSNIGDRYAAIDEEERGALDKFIANHETMKRIAEITGRSIADIWAEMERRRQQISEVTSRKRAIEAIDRQQEELNLTQKYLSQMESLSPLLSDQLNFGRQNLAIEKELSYLAIDKLLQQKPWLESKREELYLQQAIVNQAKEFAQLQKDWMTQGAMGGIKLWSFKRAGEAEARPAEAMIETFREMERTIADGLAGAIIGALRGKQVDMSEVFFLAAEQGLKRAMDLLTATAFDQLAAAFRNLLNIPTQMAPMVTAAATSSTILTAAGASLAAQMVAGATASAAILAGASALGGIGGGVGGGIGMGFGIGGLSLLGLHKGGILTAHSGLNLAPDERLIKAQTGEGILSRAAMRRLGPGGFERLNRGEGNEEGTSINVNMFVNGVTDLPTFQKTSSQIASGTTRQIKESLRNI